MSGHHIPVRNPDRRNGHYDRLSPSTLRLHSSFPPPRSPRSRRELAFDLMLGVGLPALAFVFFVVAVVGLVYLLTAIGRALRAISGGA